MFPHALQSKTLISLLVLAPIAITNVGAALNPCDCNAGSCSPTLRTSPPPFTTCGKTGSVTSPQYLQPACAYASAASCRDACLLSSSCVSYGYDSTTFECDIYSASLVSQGFRASTTSTKVFYAKSCYNANCTTGPSTVTITASASTTTVTATPTPTPRAYHLGTGFIVNYDDVDPGTVVSSTGVASSGIVTNINMCKNGVNCFSVAFNSTTGGSLTYQLGPVPVLSYYGYAFYVGISAPNDCSTTVNIVDANTNALVFNATAPGNVNFFSGYNATTSTLVYYDYVLACSTNETMYLDFPYTYSQGTYGQPPQ